MAEREGFEPPIQLPVCRISSAVLSTAQPPLRYHETTTVAELAGTKACSQPSCHASRLKGLLTPALQAPSTRGTGSCMSCLSLCEKGRRGALHSQRSTGR